MSRLVLAFALTLLVAPGLARADQPAAPPPPMLPPQPAPPAPPQPAAVPLDVLLEQRVAEELAARGTLLSRHGVTLDVEVIDQRAIVSLVEPATRRALASTKIDVLPADREAAVASVTQVAAGLVAQIASPGSQTTVAVREMLDRDRQDRREREAAEYRFRQEAITFGDDVEVRSNGKYTSVSRRWVAYQGDIRRRLDGEEFYKVISRPDLAQQYQSRRAGGVTAMVVGGLVGTGGSIFMLSKGLPDLEFCFGMPNEAQCERDQEARERAAHRNLVIGTVAMGAGWLAFYIGLHYFRNPHPISEADAQTLGAQYNAELRGKHNLSTDAAPRRRPRLHNVAVAPYFADGGGGLALGGRF
ncbi:MAG TPA: hypothetical protein VNO30_10790 [Kofleriaceae bacterium]|nr:hypothetical protein [Kofleriaceae bacterium]